MLDQAGADIVEVGIPFSDPVADGPTIMRAGQKAIAEGMTAGHIFDLLEENKSAIKCKYVLMTYYHMLKVLGEETFFTRCDAAGVYGVIIPDMPHEYVVRLKAQYPNRKVKIISLVSMTASEERMTQIAQQAEGFIYTVTMNGITGGNGEFHPALQQKIKHLQAHATVPVVAGFGIKSPEHVALVGDVADGVVIGSEIVRRLEEQGRETFIKYVEDIRQTLNRL